MRISLYYSYFREILVLFNALSFYSLFQLPSSQVPGHDLHRISWDQFFCLKSFIRFAILPYYRMNIRLMSFTLIIPKLSLALNSPLVEILWCLTDRRHIEHRHHVLVFFDWVYPTCKHFSVVWWGWHCPYLWFAIIESENSLLIDPIGVLRVVNKVNLVLLLERISRDQELVIFCICSYRAHAPRLHYIIN